VAKDLAKVAALGVGLELEALDDLGCGESVDA
jgi:hypothetical protein